MVKSMSCRFITQVCGSRLYWTYVLQGKTKPSLGNERRFVLEVCDEWTNYLNLLTYSITSLPV